MSEKTNSEKIEDLEGTFQKGLWNVRSIYKRARLFNELATELYSQARHDEENSTTTNSKSFQRLERRTRTYKKAMDKSAKVMASLRSSAGLLESTREFTVKTITTRYGN